MPIQPQGNVGWTIILLIFAGCYVHKPLPKEISEPWKVRLITLLFQTVDDMVSTHTCVCNEHHFC